MRKAARALSPFGAGARGRAITFLAFALCAVGIADAGAHEATSAALTHIRVGFPSGKLSETVWARVKEIAVTKGLDIELIALSTGYNIPNAALNAGDIDANQFQHRQFLQNEIAARGYKITAVGPSIAVSPMGLYSRRWKSLGALPDGAQVAIPNDPSNGGRALFLLAAHHAISLRAGVGWYPNPGDVTDNPKHLRFVLLDPAQTGHALDDLDAGIVNGGYAQLVGLKPSDALAIESVKGNPYSTVFAVRIVDAGKPWVKTLIASYCNPDIRRLIIDTGHGVAVPLC